MKQLLEQFEKKRKKRKVQEKSQDSNTFEMDEDPMRIGKELRGTPKPLVFSQSQKGKNTPHVDDCFMPRKTPGAQPSLKSVLQNKQIVENYDKAIEECLAKDVVQTF